MKAAGPEDMPGRLDELLGTPRLDALSAAAKALGRPDAALSVCKLAYDAAR
ncbi:MAG: hypothetical protein HY925_15800 [Elusimicrobia bacterium]|nr:hypothetical protein [Elusimicrobiota bacterium]